MRDWEAEVHRRLASLDLAPTREAEIVEALAQDLDDRYRESIAGGASPQRPRASPSPASRSAPSWFKR